MTHPPEILRDLALRLRREYERRSEPRGPGTLSGAVYVFDREELGRALFGRIFDIDHTATVQLNRQGEG